MKNNTNISDAELEVMKIIWKYSEITSNKIIEQLESKSKWKPNTIKTLINRLLNKDAISFRKDGKEYYYHSLISEDDYINEESKSFLNKIFNGSINSMVSNFVNNKKLSCEEIEELKDILNKSNSDSSNK
ncbi:BlaI/MecI/CopY family transcriptional regulator [Clostridium sp. P21]|uniref:BlaI/MecI/CopY family transcriptional regulator n=1 Tax=Clostridium muellerianum TaxID=2716538 RepID=A0A7Y0EK37_9CLOT|nr:BlaI/MecI/CopY family transcriptional regulator [Clostridium muellerianum]NMM64929.1 BlaI/MecI/CopY family transcriptional regulator [Clostridium muellerianum]